MVGWVEGEEKWRVGLREMLSGRGSIEGEKKYEWWVEGNDK